MRTIQQKPHYISQKHSIPITSLAFPLTTRLLSHNQNNSPFLSRVTKSESLRDIHLIIILRAKSIITIIISTSQRLHRRIRRERRSETTKMRLLASDKTNPGVHLTHLIRKMVKTTTEISTHELKPIHDGSERCLYSKRRRLSRQRKGLRGIGSILGSSNVNLLLLGGSKLLMRLLDLGSQLCKAPSQRFLTDSTRDRKTNGKRIRKVQMCENACDN